MGFGRDFLDPLILHHEIEPQRRENAKHSMEPIPETYYPSFVRLRSGFSKMPFFAIPVFFKGILAS